MQQSIYTTNAFDNLNYFVINYLQRLFLLYIYFIFIYLE